MAGPLGSAPQRQPFRQLPDRCTGVRVRWGLRLSIRATVRRHTPDNLANRTCEQALRIGSLLPNMNEPQLPVRAMHSFLRHLQQHPIRREIHEALRHVSNFQWTLH